MIKSFGADRALLSVGEIDTRLGLEPAVAKGYYTDLDDAISTTVDAFVHGLASLSAEYGNMRIGVLPVPPPPSQSKAALCRRRRRTVALYNRRLRSSILSLEHARRPGQQACVVLVDMFDSLCRGKGRKASEASRPEFVCDGTHLNSNVVPCLAEALSLVSL